MTQAFIDIYFVGQQRQAEEQRPDGLRQGQGPGSGVRAGRLHHHPGVQETDGALVDGNGTVSALLVSNWTI